MNGEEKRRENGRRRVWRGKKMGASGGWGAPEVLQIISGMAGRTGHHGRRPGLSKGRCPVKPSSLSPLPEPNMPPTLFFSLLPSCTSGVLGAMMERLRNDADARAVIGWGTAEIPRPVALVPRQDPFLGVPAPCTSRAFSRAARDLEGTMDLPQQRPSARPLFVDVSIHPTLKVRRLFP